MFTQTPQSKKPRRWPWVILMSILVLVGLFFFAYHQLTKQGIRAVWDSPFVQEKITQEVPTEYQGLISFVPTLLGFDAPKTYVVLFQNNTEIRPGGGFIGSYATIEVSGGAPHVLTVEGTETLDRKTPDSWKPVPPRILTQELKVDRWYFRDSNWDIDFETNAKRALEFYTQEGGIAAEKIDGVIGVDTHVIEALLEITGPVTVQGIEFDAKNVVEKLEYEVEYGFVQKQIPFENRKQIMTPLLHEIMGKIKGDLLLHPQKYIGLMETLAQEKHVFVYMTDEALQTSLRESGIAGTHKPYTTDVLLWADANLAALKTDHAIERVLAYSIQKEEQGTRSHRATMTYTHTGTFDWRTSRYRTYARVFVPKDASLVAVYATDQNGNTKPIPLTAVTQEVVGMYQTFGTLFIIEPQQERSLTFVYRFPDAWYTNMLATKQYELLVPKQHGTRAHGLTLSLDFGTTITGASPAEVQEEWGNSVYTHTTDLRIDRDVAIQF